MITLLFPSEVGAQEIKKKVGLILFLASIQFYNSVYVQDDLKSITVSLYLKGAESLGLHFCTRLRRVQQTIPFHHELS